MCIEYWGKFVAKNRSLDKLGLGLLITERKDDGWVIVDINSVDEANTGYTKAELIGRDPETCFETPDSDRSAILQAQKTVERGQPAFFASRLRKKDGSLYAARTLVSGEYDSDGNLVRCKYVSSEIDYNDPGLFSFGQRGMMDRAERMTGIGSWKYDSALKTFSISDNAYSLFEVEKTEKLEDKIRELFPKSVVQDLKNLNKTCLKEGLPYTYSYHFNRRNGSVFHGLICAEPDYDVSGNLSGIVGVVRDLTSETNLQIEHNMFMRAAKLGAIHVDDKNDTLTLSPEAASLIGLGEETIVLSAARWRDKIHPDDREQASKDYEASLETQSRAIRRYRIRHADGAWRWFEVRSDARMGDDGRPAIIYATLMNIDDQVKAEQKIKASEQRFQDVLGQSKEAIFELDASGNFIYISDMGPHLFGYTRQEMLGMKVQELYPPENAHTKNWRTKRKQAGRLDTEREMMKKNGSSIFVNINSIPVYDDKGIITGYRGTARDVTKRLAMQRELEESEERFRDVLSQSKEAIFELNSEGYFSYISDMGPEMFGYSHQELTKLAPYDLMPNPQMTRKQWLQSRISRQESDSEVLLARKDGSPIYVHFNSKVFRNPEGNIIGIRGAARDITHQKQVQAELEVNEERFKEVIENANGCVYETDANGCFTYLSESSLELFGYDPAELIGKPTYILSTTPAQGHEAWIKGLHKAGGFTVDEQKLLKKDGSNDRWLRVSGHAIYDKNDEISGFRGAVFDITERKNIAEKVNESQERLKEVVRAADGWTFDLDEDGRFTFASAAIEHLVGYSSQDLIGQHTWVLAEDLKKNHHLWLRAIRKSESGFTHEFLLNDKKTWLEVHCIARFDSNGDCFGYRGVAFDISQKKFAEKEVIRAKEAAEAAAEERARFLSTMSHEIRTPLNAVIGMTDLLLGSEQDSEQQKLTKSANMAGHHLLNLVNDILDHSKLEAGKVILENTAFDVKEEIENVYEILKANADQKHVSLSCFFDEALASGYSGDPARVRQVLINLVGNAIKFSENGSVAICAAPAQTGGVRFEIQDDGIGIEQEAQQRLFQEFSQADASTTRKHGGTGLGLAISKRLVEVMEGQIGVHSVVGKGSTFWFEIPLQALASFSSERVAPPGEITDETEEKCFKVLVAEDNPANQLLMRTLLEKLGQEVTIVENGQLAVEMASSTNFDLIFMDMQMPVMDGYTAARTLRELGNKTPIIALTAHVIKDEEHKFRAAGMNDWLSKPFNMTDLVKRLYSWGSYDHHSEDAPEIEQAG
jgi:PAS domain S-box-containing protein